MSMMFFYEIEVLEEYRNQSVGKALIEELKKMCERKNILKMFVLTNESNLAAMKLYESAGGERRQEGEVQFEWFF